jgi:2-oxo-4-hydroxy-4-carboxy-5-ureidoimidazoline decarboxylase
MVDDAMLPHAWLDSRSPEEAREALARCCGSRRWVAGMLDRRPFGSDAGLSAAAHAVWAALDRDDYLEAFSFHPAIGASIADRDAKPKTSLGWSKEEQSGVVSTDARIQLELQAANSAYRERFGFVFIICATGKSAKEMLGALRARLGNDPRMELALAAAEQAKITDLRLDKLGR